MSWSLGSAGDLAAIPPILPVPSDTERLREMFGFRSSDLPLLRSAMSWLTDNNPEGIISVQINLLKYEGKYTETEAAYSDEDYALVKADVLEFDVNQRGIGLEILQQRYREKIWNALDLDHYFCKESYFATGATSGRS